MRFNGVDLNLIHPSISRSSETLPGMPAMDISTIETSRGELLAKVSLEQDEYTARVNISGRTYDEAMDARLALAAWAGSSNRQTAELEPTYMPGKAYTAIVKSIGRVTKRFETVDVVFLLPRPVLHDVVERKATATGKELALNIGGTASTQLVISHVLSQAAQGLTLELGGHRFFAMEGDLKSGQTVEVNMHTAAVLVDGVHAEKRILWTETDLDVELMPGRHNLTANVPGNMTARWRNEWL